MSVDLESLLSAKVDDAKYPEALPAGTYYGVVNAYKFDYMSWTNKDGSKPFGVHFTIGFNDVQASLRDEIAEKGIDLSKKGGTVSFELGTESNGTLSMNERSGYYKDFVIGLGIPTAGRSFRETAPDARGKAVMCDVAVYADKKTGVARNRINRASAVPTDE